MLPTNDPGSPTISKEVEALKRDLRALWRRIDNLGTGGGGGGLVIVDDDEPEAEVGQLWYDTDAGV